MNTKEIYNNTTATNLKIGNIEFEFMADDKYKEISKAVKTGIYNANKRMQEYNHNKIISENENSEIHDAIMKEIRKL